MRHKDEDYCKIKSVNLVNDVFLDFESQNNFLTSSKMKLKLTKIDTYQTHVFVFIHSNTAFLCKPFTEILENLINLFAKQNKASSATAAQNNFPEWPFITSKIKSWYNYIKSWSLAGDEVIDFHRSILSKLKDELSCGSENYFQIVF